MSAADESSPALSLRRLPFTTRLSPQLVNQLVSEREKLAALGEISGLLFGAVEEGLVLAQARRKFDDAAKGSGLADHLSQNKLFEQHLVASQKHPDTAALKLIGWYAIRETGGLSGSDLIYHDWYFPNPQNLVLILNPQGSSGIALELYCRTVAGSMTEEAYRVGLARLSNDPVESPVEIVPRPKIQDDFFMRAYELGDTEEGKTPAGWKGTLAVRYRKVFSFLRPNVEEPEERAVPEPPVGPAPRQENIRETHKLVTPLPIGPARLPSANAPVHPARALSVPPPVVGLPVVTEMRGAIPSSAAKGRRIWLPVVAAFLLTFVFTFGVIYYLRATDSLPPFLQFLAASSALGLKVETQGSRLLLSWNRQQLSVKHARFGLLQIEDGPQRRQVTLDSSQVANGSILYHPTSEDVIFRLRVHSDDGRDIFESMRVLEPAKPVALDLSPDVPAIPASRGGPSSPGVIAPQTSALRPPSLKGAPASERTNKSSALQARTENPIVEKVAPALKPKDDRVSKLASKDEEVLSVPEDRAAKQIPAVPDQGSANQAPLLGSPAPQSLGQPKTEQPKVEESKKEAPVVTTRGTLAAYLPPRPTRQVLPNLSGLPAGIMALTGQLEVLVKVDETGKVIEARAQESGKKVNAVLVKSALDAARQWKFVPATLRGKAVASQHSILFQFTPRR